MPFEDRAFEVVVEENPGNTAPVGERFFVAAQEVLGALPEEETKEDGPLKR